MNPFFPEIKRNFGFGMMRLPMAEDKVDLAMTTDMVDAFLAAGFNYFDTAHPYIQGQSETAIRDCLVKRYPRDSYILTNKLSGSYFEKEEEIRPLIELQLAQCGVEYFDFLLMHAMSAERHEKYLKTRAYDIAQELKGEGKLCHVGISFHDTAEVLDKILTDRPEIEVVQLQMNYVDMDDPRVQGRACYEVCRKHGKPVIVMEPVKGGSLVNLPETATSLMTSSSPASYAIRYVAGFENVMMVLSGMSNMEQMTDNLSYMTDFRPLNQEELAVIDQVRTIYQSEHRVPCTACRYCTDGCPAGIPIPDVFQCFNDSHRGEEGAAAVYAGFANNASACVGCGQCEAVCPQQLQIRQLLKAVEKRFG